MFFGKFRIDIGDASIHADHFFFESAALPNRARFIGFPHFEAEDVAQDILAPARILLRKLIGFTLQEERGIDKGVIIEPQNLFNAGLRFTGRTLG